MLGNPVSKAEPVEFAAASLVELVLELHPVKTQGMQEGLHEIH